MRLTRLKIREIGTHRSIDLPISDLGINDRIVAIVGDNGTGKTTALECGPGTIYTSTPSRGPLAGLAKARDSEVIVGYDVGGVALEARAVINGVSKSRKSEWYLTADGLPLEGVDGKKADFAREVAARFPSPEVYLSSGFAAQRSEGFLGLQPAARKRLFVEMLGLDRLDKIADAAGDRASAIDADLVGLRARSEQLRDHANSIGDLSQDLESREAEAELVTAEIGRLEDEIEAGRKALDAWRDIESRLRAKGTEARAAMDRLTDREQSMVRDIDTKRGECERIKERIGRSRKAIEDEPSLRAIVDATEGARARLEELESEQTRARDAERAYLEAESRWREQRTAAQSALAEAKRLLRDAESQASLLPDVPCGGQGEFVRCPLLGIAGKAAASITGLSETVGVRGRSLDDILVPIAPSLPNLSAEIADARVRLEERRSAMARLESMADARERIAEDEASVAVIDKSIDTMRLEAEALCLDVAGAQAALGNARSEWAAHNDRKPADVPTGRLTEVRNQLSFLQSAIGSVRAKLERATQDKAELADIDSKAEALAKDLDDWRHLKAAFGTKIKALEIDAAGPEVSEITNGLLHGCYGSRFTVRLITSERKADGKGHKEVFGLHVIDSEKGWEGDAAGLSGGERVLVGEALSLAIAIFNSRKSTIPITDLFRDEVAGALSTERGPLYVQMLRKALDIGGFGRVYFVTHSPGLASMADSRILFTDDGCRMED